MRAWGCGPCFWSEQLSDADTWLHALGEHRRGPRCVCTMRCARMCATARGDATCDVSTCNHLGAARDATEDVGGASSAAGDAISFEEFSTTVRDLLHASAACVPVATRAIFRGLADAAAALHAPAPARGLAGSVEALAAAVGASAGAAISTIEDELFVTSERLHIVDRRLRGAHAAVVEAAERHTLLAKQAHSLELQAAGMAGVQKTLEVRRGARAQLSSAALEQLQQLTVTVYRCGVVSMWGVGGRRITGERRRQVVSA